MGVFAIPQADPSTASRATSEVDALAPNLWESLEGAWQPNIEPGWGKIPDLSGNGRDLDMQFDDPETDWKFTERGRAYATNTNRWGSYQYDVSRWSACTIALLYRRTHTNWGFPASLMYTSASLGISLYRPSDSSKYEFISNDGVDVTEPTIVTNTGLRSWEFICITQDNVSQTVTGYLYDYTPQSLTASLGGSHFDYAGADGLFQMATRNNITGSVERGDYIGCFFYSRALGASEVQQLADNLDAPFRLRPEYLVNDQFPIPPGGDFPPLARFQYVQRN